MRVLNVKKISNTLWAGRINGPLGSQPVLCEFNDKHSVKFASGLEVETRWITKSNLTKDGIIIHV